MASGRKKNQVTREQLTDQQWADCCRLFSRMEQLRAVARQRLAERK